MYTYIKFKASDKEFKGHRDSRVQLQIVDFNTVTTILVKSLQWKFQNHCNEDWFVACKQIANL